MTAPRRANRPTTPVGPDVPGRVDGPYVSDLCRAGEHQRCRHPANHGRVDGCECPCHPPKEAA